MREIEKSKWVCRQKSPEDQIDKEGKAGEVVVVLVTESEGDDGARVRCSAALVSGVAR